MSTEVQTTPANGQASETKPGDLATVPAKPLTFSATDDSENAVLFDSRKFEQAQRVANLFANSDMVPAQFQKKPANCFIACQLATRMGLDPFMVMQNSCVVHGRPGFEAKLIIALINKSGLFKDPLDYEFSGTAGKDDWTCTVSAVRKSTGKKIEYPFRYGVARAEGWVDKSGSKWKTMPEQMMRYRAAVFFARVYCPEVTMGMQTADELEDMGPEPTIADLPQGRSSFRTDAPGTGTTPLPASVIDTNTGAVLGTMKSDGEFVPEKPADDGKPEPLFGKGGNIGTVDRNLSNPRGKSPAL